MSSYAPGYTSRAFPPPAEPGTLPWSGTCLLFSTDTSTQMSYYRYSAFSKYLYTCFWLHTLTEIHRLYSQVLTVLLAPYLRLNLYSIFQEGLHKPAALPIPKPFHLKGGKRPPAFQSAAICSSLSQSPVDWLPLHTSFGYSCSSDRVIAEHKQSWAESSNRNPGWFHFCALVLY